MILDRIYIISLLQHDKRSIRIPPGVNCRTSMLKHIYSIILSLNRTSEGLSVSCGRGAQEYRYSRSAFSCGTSATSQARVALGQEPRGCAQHVGVQRRQRTRPCACGLQPCGQFSVELSALRVLIRPTPFRRRIVVEHMYKVF